MCTRVSCGHHIQTNQNSFANLPYDILLVCLGEEGTKKSDTAGQEKGRGSRGDSPRDRGGTRRGEPDCPTLDGNLAPTIGRWAEACFPSESQTTESELRELLHEAAESAKDNYGPEDAVAWAKGYTFPEEFVRNDLQCLEEAQGDFQMMVRKRQADLAPGRLNSDRVSRLRPDNPEIALLNDLVVGMKVHLPEGFTANGKMPRTDRRPIYETVASAVNKLLGSIVDDKLAFLLPLNIAQERIPNLHLCKAHWTVKKGKPSGRPLGDLSNVDGTKINTDETAAAAAEYYGEIHHPTIDDIAVMIYDFWMEAKQRDPSVQWSNMRIWKMDLRGAYTLLSFRPEDVGLFAMLVSDDLVYLQMVGIFGWTGTPAAFQVVTRALTWEMRHALQSHVLMYVDDILGVCFVADIDADLALARNICTSLLGPGSVADDKTDHGVRLDMIGYTISLPDNRVSISRKNFLTALHGFISTNVSKRITLRTAQRIASYGTRYGKICRVMRPFCSALYRVTWGRVDDHAQFYLSPEAIIAVQCWRAMLCLVRFKETEFTRTIQSFAPSTPVLVAEFDSSLSGTGVIWFVRENGAEVMRGVSAVNLMLLDFGFDSSNQNLAEYIGAVIAVLGHVMLGFSGLSIALRGDSITALTWTMTERPRGTRVTNAAMVWTLLCIAANVEVKEVTHIPGEENEQCDRLSRRWDEGRTPTMSVAEEAEEMGLIGVEVLEMDLDPSVRGIIELCDPRKELSSESQFIDFWMRTRSAIDSFMTAHNHPPQRPSDFRGGPS